MSRLLATVFAGLLSLASSQAFCQDKLQALAARGQIQEDAPVKAAAQIAIHASPQRIWALLTSINDWPQWQSTVSTAHIDGALSPGTTFTWKNGSTTIQSRIALVNAYQQISWTGTAFNAKAIHLWSLQPMKDGTTLVKTTESMDGFLLSHFYSSEDLADSLNTWLQALQHKAEESPASPRR